MLKSIVLLTEHSLQYDSISNNKYYDAAIVTIELNLVTLSKKKIYMSVYTLVI